MSLGGTVKKVDSVLIVENDAELCVTLKQALEGRDRKVVIASDGVIALEKLEKQKFNAIVLDADLNKKISGIRVLKEIRDQKTALNSDTPVILCSGTVDRETLNAYRGLYSDVVVKPVDLKIICQKLDHWCQLKHESKGKTVDTTSVVQKVLVVSHDRLEEQDVKKLEVAFRLKITFADSAEEASRKSLNAKYNSIVLDLDADKTGAVRFLAEVKSAPSHPNFKSPFWALTSAPAGVPEALRHHLAGIIAKPLTSDSLGQGLCNGPVSSAA